ncbi:MAG: amidohydrolase [Bacteroidales bacterium]|nr:amidohydrolase [Bacteroidales bacterium]
MEKNLIKADLIIKNGLVVTINKEGQIIEDGAVAIKDDSIIAIGNSNQIMDQYFADQVIDAKDKIVMPGFVNSHTHLAMTVFRGMADDIKLTDWLHKYIFPAEKKHVSRKMVEVGTSLAVAEMIHGGTTCFNDMYYYQDVTAEIATEFGIRGIVSEGLIDFPVPNSPTPKDGMEFSAKMIEKHKKNPLIDFGIAVHAPYSCSENLMIDAKKIADYYDVNYHIHVAETKWEFDKMIAEQGKTPVQYLDSLGILSDNVIAAHGVWLTDEDIKIVAEKGVGIAHNPVCNMKISSGAARIPELFAVNAKVGLGTDGVASNNNLNMIQEMNTMAMLHKFNKMDPTVFSAEKVVRTATIGSAEVLRKDKEIGSLEVGKKADIILIETNLPNVTPIFNVYSSIVYSMLGNEVTDVIINGKQIMRNNILLTINENSIKHNAREFSKNINLQIS